MRKIWRVVAALGILLGVSYIAESQVLSVEAGYAFSEQHGSQFNLLPEGRHSFAGGLSLEYLRMPNFSLRSGLAFRAVGGKDTQNAPFTSGKQGRKADETFHMLQINTVARTGLRAGVVEFFLGLGPKADILLGKAVFKEQLFVDYKVNRALFGLRYEAGIDVWMADDRVKLGLLGSYEHDVSSFAKAEGNKLYNQTYGVQLSLGFRLGGRGRVGTLQSE